VNLAERQATARLLENATRAYEQCRFVITTRPGSYKGLSTLQGFHEARIEELDARAIEGFLQRWSGGLFPKDPAGARRHLRELLAALEARAEIRQMARNPVMLTALAVVHWNEKRLPEQRPDLYDSILTWLARARPNRVGREPAETCLALLSHLAMEMQDQPEGRVTLISPGRGHSGAALPPVAGRRARGARAGLSQRRRSG
jgi:hypothetical protein